MKMVLHLVTACLFLGTSATAIPFQFRYVFEMQKLGGKPINAEIFFDSPSVAQLARAAAEGNTNQIVKLAAAGADVNAVGKNGMRPLFWALIHENLRGFRCLIELGADPGAVVGTSFPASQSALTLAASLPNSDYLEILLKKGANPNLPASQVARAPIFSAIDYRRTNNIAVLLRHGADIEWKSVSGGGPLMHAIEQGNFEAALFLFRLGADALVKDRWGYSSVDTLLKYQDKAVNSRRDRAAYKQLMKELELAGLLKDSGKATR